MTVSVSATLETISQLTVDQTNGFGKADVGVVEIAETAECTRRQDYHRNTANARKHLTMNVILHDSRQAPANVQIRTCKRVTTSVDRTEIGKNALMVSGGVQQFLKQSVYTHGGGLAS